MHVSIHARSVYINQDALRALVTRRIEALQSGATRVEVQVSDLNGPRGGPDDKRVLVEIPIPGGSSVVTEDRASNAMEAARRALKRAAAEIRRRVSRRRDRRRSA
jgi:ribosome-associated translation inhibitor RaiA